MSWNEALLELKNRFDTPTEIRAELFKQADAYPVLADRTGIDDWKFFLDRVLSVIRRESQNESQKPRRASVESRSCVAISGP